MNIALFGNHLDRVHDLLTPYPDAFIVVENPEYVIVFGGDGTFMQAEHVFPGVPKIFLRNSAIAKLAPRLSNEAILRCFFEKQFDVVEHMKLEVLIDGVGRGIAVNDVVVHNENPRTALRYKVSIDGSLRYEQVIGDGVVCATPLGSTGYYRSITDSSIETGIGLAFNNSTEQADHIVLKESSVISVEIIRGPGFCYLDNQEDLFPLVEGSVVTIQMSSKHARLVLPKHHHEF